MSHNYLYFHLNKKKSIMLFDRLFMLAAIAYPLSSLPQVVEVFNGKSTGVSILSWSAFAFFSLLFIIYGTIHKVKPMVVTNSLWFIVQSLVVMGVVIHRI